MGDHTESTKSKKPEDVEAFLNSEEFVAGFKEYASNGLRDWITNNPESAQALGHNMLKGLSTVAEISFHLWPIIRIFLADAEAEERMRRYQMQGVPISFDEAVTLASLLMAFRLPYMGQEGPDDGGLPYVRDYEILSVYALRDNQLSKLIEASRSSPLVYRALELSLRRLRDTQKPIPSELLDWALDVAAGTRRYPKLGPEPNPYKNQVRDAMIIETVRILVECGLTATRNEASPPESACDAVSQVLSKHGVGLGYEGVAKVWRERDRSPEEYSVGTKPQVLT